jgi:uncharacterized damage-inducible protein DinB
MLACGTKLSHNPIVIEYGYKGGFSMFNTIDGFRATWSHMSGNTKKIMENLTDDSLKQRVAGDHRNLGRVAWHIIQSIPEMAGQTGLKVRGPGEKEPVPETAAEIAGAYMAASDSLADQVSNNWKDKTLEVEDDLYGETWKRGLTLRILIDHEIHHRGQMTVLMRQAGLPVPGIYGPSKEEWARFNMKEPEI